VDRSSSCSDHVNFLVDCKDWQKKLKKQNFLIIMDHFSEQLIFEENDHDDSPTNTHDILPSLHAELTCRNDGWRHAGWWHGWRQ